MVNIIIVNTDCMSITINFKTINDIIEPFQYRKYTIKRGTINIKTQTHPANISKFVKYDQVYFINPHGWNGGDYCDINKKCIGITCSLPHFDYLLLSKYKEDKQ